MADQRKSVELALLLVVIGAAVFVLTRTWRFDPNNQPDPFPWFSFTAILIVSGALAILLRKARVASVGLLFALLYCGIEAQSARDWFREARRQGYTFDQAGRIQPKAEPPFDVYVNSSLATAIDVYTINEHGQEVPAGILIPPASSHRFERTKRTAHYLFREPGTGQLIFTLKNPKPAPAGSLNIWVSQLRSGEYEVRYQSP